jgi:hypothetical protein
MMKQEGGTKRNEAKRFDNSIFGVTANTTVIRHVDEAASFELFHEEPIRKPSGTGSICAGLRSKLCLSPSLGRFSDRL